MTRLITLNVWDGRLQASLESFFSCESPDIACMQEVARFAEPGYDWLRAGLPELASWAGLPCTVMAPMFGQAYMHTRLELGNAIMSSAPICEHPVTWTAGSYNGDFDLAKHVVPRNFQHVETQGVHVFNYHGQRERNGAKLGTEQDVAAMERLASQAAVPGGRVIVAGDFNLWPESPALAPLRANLRDLGAEAGVKNTRTWLKGRQEVSDYVFVSPDITVGDFYVSDRVASDHAALVLDFA
jgi:endonuclease/exonuclease/phosphatase (EEP) superfamily protein YafD